MERFVTNTKFKRHLVKSGSADVWMFCYD